MENENTPATPPTEEIPTQSLQTAKNDPPVPTQSGPTPMRCRHCREEIQPGAVFCRYCRLFQSRKKELFHFGPNALILLMNIGVAVLGVSAAFLGLWFTSQQRTKAEEALEKARGIAEVAVQGNQASVGAKRAYDQLLKKREANDRDIAYLAEKWAEAVESDLAVYRVPIQTLGAFQQMSIRIAGQYVDPHDAPTERLFKELSDPSMEVYSRKQVMLYIAIRSAEKKQIARLALLRLSNSEYLPELAAICGVLFHAFGNQAEFMDLQGWQRYLKDFLAGP